MKQKFTFEEWHTIKHPYRYRVGVSSFATIITTDERLALSFGRPIEYLGQDHSDHDGFCCCKPGNIYPTNVAF